MKQNKRGITVLMLALLMIISTGQAQLKVFILAGQSNMEGYATTWTWMEPDLQPNGMLDWLVEQPEYQDDFAHLVDGLGLEPGVTDTVRREDVWVYWKNNRNSPGDWKIPGYGVINNKTHAGPESGIGWVLGESFDEQVLLIKTCWGGKSLGEAFLPPSMGGPGPNYTLMVEEVNEVLADIGSFFPDYDDAAGYELIGFQWHQGWNDKFNDLDQAYEENLVAFISDVREEFGVENLPFVIGETGMSYPFEGEMDLLTTSQMNVADPALYPAHEGNVAFVPTNQYSDFPNTAPYGGFGYHWSGSFYSYYSIGRDMGEAMLTLLPEGEEVPGCMDTLYVEYDPTATVDDPAACVTLITVGVHFAQDDLSGDIQVNQTRLEMTLAEAGRHEILLYNLKGKLMYRTELFTKGKHIFNVNLKPGLYQMMMRGPSEVIVNRKVAVM